MSLGGLGLKRKAKKLIKLLGKRAMFYAITLRQFVVYWGRKFKKSRLLKLHYQPGPVIEYKPEKPTSRVLLVVDQYGWAYYRVCVDLYKKLKKLRPNWAVSICSWSELMLYKVDVHQYEAILFFPWINADPPMFYTRRFPPEVRERVIFMACSERAGELVIERPGELVNVKHLAAANKQIADQIQAVYPDKIVFNLEHGHDLNLFHPRAFPNEFKVLWIGNQGRALKRFKLAREACELAGVPLIQAGQAEHTRVPAEDMPNKYGEGSILLITSESEAHPMVYYEGLASGRPVVSTLVGDIPETADEGVNGFYFQVDVTSEELAEAILKLKNDPQLLQKMGAAARESVEKWSWDVKALDYIRAIDYVAKTYSSVMLVSRMDHRLETAIQSVLQYNPDEFAAYVDDQVLHFTKAKDRIQEICRETGYLGPVHVRRQTTTGAEDHHDDVTRNVHRAIINARYPRVQWLDDDDELLINPRDYLHLMTPRVGIVYGDVKQLWVDGRKKVEKSKPVTYPGDAINVKGSAALYNRDALNAVHRRIDVNRQLSEHLKPDWFGYYWDYQMVYWLKRREYFAVYSPGVWSIQNVNPAPGKKRKSLYGRWPDIVMWYNEHN